jgi:excisionase family DNA binding protein
VVGIDAGQFVGDNAGTMPDRTPNQTKPDHDRTTIAEAAKRLGVSTDAIRKRLSRGQLQGEKVGGTWVVFLPAATSQTIHSEYFDRTPDRPRPEADRTGPDDRDRLIAALENDIQFLRRELDTRNDELERRDVLLREALGRIPALPAGLSQVGMDESRADHPTDSPDGPGSTETETRQSNTSQAFRSWWRRVLGMRE